jgi:polysaccharide biosynthesis protein PelE
MRMSPSPPVQEARRDGNVWSVFAVAAMVLTTFGEFALVVAGTLNSAPIGLLIAAHGVIGLSLIVGCLPRCSRSRENPQFLLFVVCIVMMGPLGPFGTALTIALRRRFSQSATSFAEWYASLFPEIVVSQPQTLYRLLVLRGARPPSRSTVSPFLDVVALGTVEQKRAVIALIAGEFQPAFAPAIQSALNDADPAIRVQAASAVAHIDAGFVNRAMALQARCTAQPNDGDAILELARHREAYAESGLLDESRAHAEMTEALACYERANALGSADASVLEAITRLLLQVGRADEALLRLGPLVARSDPSANVLAGYFACLFRRGQFAQVREACRLFNGRLDPATLPEGLGEALRLWSGDAVDDFASRPVAGGMAA